ncbi:fructose-specific PTS transporter subunit EIIC [Globicatella sanguinis]|uniref:fructose-specific PTS transporter subunit EIIC n=1 Tax=Globicatella sanguinis TaxID=13076 RepID=UPI000C7A7136|nr:fructose-specific PTS transporter subunit EIIC [Globicatella sanguinis]MDK7630540.1 fructose-specific PTS transporter subunit EIIC [Globicatella sanguinis]WIK67441.1 fructose-specific PTS transporter subunit EIIC [Globicatella sanguinis]WKT56846.1 fructose-specific PTS transporter subunit EIIC [Globicatella sanguinis]
MSQKILAITACPVGVAHTYMAAENLERAGETLGVDIKVETHGSIGIENQFTEEEINQAEGIIIASDKDIEKSRFAGKRIIEVPVRVGIDKPQQLIQDILAGKGKVYQGTTRDKSNSQDSGNILYRALMNGVSYMVPFVVTGGLLIAIALSLGGVPTEAGFSIPEGSFWSHINGIGGAAMGFMVPILSGFIAYAIADRPGLVPGVIGGFIAVNGSFYGSEANTGFIGGIIAGFLAGYVAKMIKKIPVPKALNSIMPIIIIPVFSTVIVGLLFIYLIGQPVASLFSGLTSLLASMHGANSIILAGILGAMVAVDMGGPFNKTAFLFGSGLIAEGVYTIMGAVAVAICIPPIAVGLAAHILKDRFTEADRQAGTASFIMGLFGITEGAIPFAAKNPARIIPSIVVGSMVGSIIGMIFGVGDHVAHGGPIVAVLGAVDNVFMFFVAVAIGVVVTIVMIRLLMPKIETASLEPVAAPVQSEKTAQESIALTDLMTEEMIILDIQSEAKEGAFNELISLPSLKNRISDQSAVLEAIKVRETQGTTGLGEGIAIPHAKSDAIKEPTVIFGKSQNGIDWQSLDGENVKVAFLILVPEKQKGDMHLKILQILSRKLMDAQFKNDLINANTKEEVYNILKTVK